ncbi:MAG: hypothetical protein AB7K09_05625 [Planctomycetota bacterium]
MQRDARDQRNTRLARPIAALVLIALMIGGTSVGAQAQDLPAPAQPQTQPQPPVDPQPQPPVDPQPQPPVDPQPAASQPRVAIRALIRYQLESSQQPLDIPADQFLNALKAAMPSLDLAADARTEDPSQLAPAKLRAAYPVARLLLIGTLTARVTDTGGVQIARLDYDLKVLDVRRDGATAWSESVKTAPDIAGVAQLDEVAADRVIARFAGIIGKRLDAELTAYLKANPEIVPTPVPVDPTPVDPTPVDPTPVDPTPVDPTPVDPTPTPVDPTPVDPTPVDPTPTPVDPTPTPVDPTPVNPEDPRLTPIHPPPIRPEDVKYDLRQMELLRPIEFMGGSANLQQFVATPFPLGSTIGKGKLRVTFGVQARMEEAKFSNSTESVNLSGAVHEGEFTAMLGIVDWIDFGIRLSAIGRSGNASIGVSNGATITSNRSILEFGEPRMLFAFDFYKALSKGDRTVVRAVTLGLGLKIGVHTSDSDINLTTGGGDTLAMLGVTFADDSKDNPDWSVNLTIGGTIGSTFGEQDLFNSLIDVGQSFYVGASGSFHLLTIQDMQFSVLVQAQLYTSAISAVSTLFDDVSADIIVGGRGQLGPLEGTAAAGLTIGSVNGNPAWMLMFRLGYYFEKLF